ncbi:DUF4388 domain-containing protein [Anaeromyxobacter sp. Fw109-5]|uniref:DUF4388 domain-containing protein n=1 Tax=Anaeromyxobacter sp. (strain Fw109-5) TaxID=404589 RepID=UPI0000ED8266|nr:DUF4388 domain-containing protein [Anaeromyxobacter sp. Fw109-5]ABS26066.1 response regulator receiver protein [Anaeromyxobacter sp. Fw109-5]
MRPPLSGKRLLLVAEDRELAAVIAGAAARLGAEVSGVKSGRAALAAVAARAPDAAVLDLPLPDVRGSELLEALLRAGVAPIVVSGVHRGARAFEEVRRLGAHDFFEKPFEVEAVVAAVARAIGAEAPPLAEAPDEVTGGRPLERDEIPDAVAASFAGQDADVAPAPVAGLALPLPAARSGHAPSLDAPPRPAGELGEASVPRLCVALHVGQATGALTLERGPVRKLLLVERGVPVYAASNVAAERFSTICVRRGEVTPEAVETMSRAAPDERLGDALVARGLMTAERRVALVQAQVRAIVWSTFEWREGRYAFQPGRPPEGRVDLRLPMADLVLEGMRRASTLPCLRAELPAHAHLAPSPDPAFELYALKLRREEAKLLALADGTKGVSDLVRLSEVPERDALAFLQACRVMRVLDEVERLLAGTRRIGFM